MHAICAWRRTVDIADAVAQSGRPMTRPLYVDMRAQPLLDRNGRDDLPQRGGDRHRHYPDASGCRATTRMRRALPCSTEAAQGVIVRKSITTDEAESASLRNCRFPHSRQRCVMRAGGRVRLLRQ